MSENTEKAAEQTAKPAPKKAMTRGRIVAAVVVAVVILAGCGMFAWHNSPSFCGTVCHTPMSKYVADFEAGPVDGVLHEHFQVRLFKRVIVVARKGRLHFADLLADDGLVA